MLRDEQEMFVSLVRLMFDNPNIGTWRFKVTGENNGRGMALFVFNTSKYLQEQKYSSAEQKRVLTEEVLLSKLGVHVKHIFPMVLQPLQNSLFETPKEYMAHFYR